MATKKATVKKTLPTQAEGNEMPFELESNGDGIELVLIGGSCRR
jgi:hypothetical protein